MFARKVKRIQLNFTSRKSIKFTTEKCTLIFSFSKKNPKLKVWLVVSGSAYNETTRLALHTILTTYENLLLVAFDLQSILEGTPLAALTESGALRDSGERL